MPLRLGIVGTGNVARQQYLPFLSRQDDVELMYLNRTRSKADACAESFGGRVVDSVAGLVSAEPDAILVLTHETQRLAASRALLDEKPRRLFFEKPLVARNGQANVCEDDFVDAREMLKRARAAGTQTAMVFNYRFFDQTVRAQRIISERAFGPLRQASLFVNYACWSHCIDLLTLFGGRATEIVAIEGSTPYGAGNQRAVDVTACFRLAGGATGTIVGTSGTSFAFSLYEIYLSFEKGIVRFSDLDNGVEVFENGSPYAERHDLVGSHGRSDQYDASFGKALAAYLDTVRRAEPPPVPGIAGLEELQFEAALRRAVAAKRPVDVQREFPLDA